MAHYDLLVIGTGPAGQKAAVQAAKFGKKVGLIEKKEVVGGVCINTGTIPSKALREAVLYFSGIPQRSIYGTPYRFKETVHIEELVRHANYVITNEIKIVHDQLTRNRVDLIFGSASFLDPHRLRVQHRSGASEHTADFIVIAVGTEPSRPPSIPFDDASIIDTDGLLTLKRLPSSLVIVGGGVIGTEYASMLAALGIPTTLIDKGPRLLEFADAEIIDWLQRGMKDFGVTVYHDEEVLEIKKEPDNSINVVLRHAKSIQASTLMYAIGRVGATKGLNLEAAGLKPDHRGRLSVNKHFQTAVPHIYGAGDVIGFPALASTSMQQGRNASCNAFGHPNGTDNSLLPYGIYSIPQLSMVGRNEAELTQDGVPYAVGIARYKEIARGLLMGDETGMLQLLFHRQTYEVLGVHIIGEGATELIHIGQAIMAHRSRIQYFIDTVFNYPTLAECYRVAALDGINRLPRPWAPYR